MSRTSKILVLFSLASLLAALLFATAAKAQDMPQPKPILDLNYYVAKIRTLEFERDQVLGYVAELRTKLDEVQKENMALKEKMKKHEK